MIAIIDLGLLAKLARSSSSGGRSATSLQIIAMVVTDVQSAIMLPIQTLVLACGSCGPDEDESHIRRAAGFCLRVAQAH